MRVLTLNIWNDNEPLEKRFSALKAGLRTLRPDIVCLQEVADDPRSMRRQSDIIGEFCGLQHRYDEGELSTLSRYTVIRSASIDLPQAVGDDDRRRLLLTECRTDDGPLLVANTHFAWRPHWTEERQMQAHASVAAIASFVPAEARIGRILCGDFNDDPGSPAVRLLMKSSLGFRDSFAACHPHDDGFTFALENPHVDRKQPRGQRIDYIFATADVRVKDCVTTFDGRDGVDFASDHYGVLADFTLR